MKSDTPEKTIFGGFDRKRLGQPAFICLWLALITLLVYLPVFHAQFIGFDDDEYVFANPHVLSGITRANLRWAADGRRGVFVWLLTPTFDTNVWRAPDSKNILASGHEPY
jgi:hypothetical protein